MPQSLSELYVHLVFSTKHRQPFITPDIEPDLYSYMAAVLWQECDSPARKIGGFDDHIHLLINQSRNWSIADIVKEIKCKSSRWIKQQSSGFSKFYWQSGYGAFSVSKSAVPEVERYISNQREWHQTRDFQSEYRSMLLKHDISFDERYVWD